MRRLRNILVVYKWRNILIDYQAFRLKCSIRIQALIRRFLQRLKLPEKQRRRFPVKFVHRSIATPSGRKRGILTSSFANLSALLGQEDYDHVDPKFTIANRERRKAILFLNLHIGELENFEKLHSAARKIQRKYRKVVWKRWNAKAVAERAVLMSKRIIRWYRYQCWLQDRDDAAWVIQCGWKARLGRLAPFHRAARTIQRWLRFKASCYKRKSRINTIQRFWRTRLCIYRLRQMVKFKRSVSEQLAAGLALFVKSNEGIVAECMWAGINSKGYVGDSKVSPLGL
jgi:hypothetical protein